MNVELFNKEQDHWGHASRQEWTALKRDQNPWHSLCLLPIRYTICDNDADLYHLITSIHIKNNPSSFLLYLWIFQNFFYLSYVSLIEIELHAQ